MNLQQSTYYNYYNKVLRHNTTALKTQHKKGAQ